MNEARGRPLGPQQIQDSRGAGEDGDGGEAAGGPGSTWPQLTVWSWWFWLSAARILGFLPLGFVDQLPRASTTWTRYSVVVCCGLTAVRASTIALFFILVSPFQTSGTVFRTVYIGMVMLKAAVMTVASVACLREGAVQCAVVAALRHSVAMQPLGRPESWARLAAVNAAFLALLLFFPGGLCAGSIYINLTVDCMTLVCDAVTTILFVILHAVFCNEAAVLWVLCAELRLDVFGLLTATAPSPWPHGSPTGPGPAPASPSTVSDASLSRLSLWSAALDSDHDEGVPKVEAKVEARVEAFRSRAKVEAKRPLAKSGAVCSLAKAEAVCSLAKAEAVCSLAKAEAVCSLAEAEAVCSAARAALPDGRRQSPTLHVRPVPGSAASWRQMRLRLLRLHDIRTALCSACGWPNLLGIAMYLIDAAVSIFEDLASHDNGSRESYSGTPTLWGFGVVVMFVLVCSVCQQVQNEHAALEHLLSGFLARLPDVPLDVKDEVRGFVAQIQLHGHGRGFTAGVPNWCPPGSRATRWPAGQSFQASRRHASYAPPLLPLQRTMLGIRSGGSGAVAERGKVSGGDSGFPHHAGRYLSLSPGRPSLRATGPRATSAGQSGPPVGHPCFTALDIISINTTTMASTLVAVFSYIVVLVQFDRSSRGPL